MKILLLATILLGIPSLGYCETETDSLDDVGKRMSLFYLEPSEGEFESIQHEVKANLNEITTRKADVPMLLAVFLGTVHLKYGWSLLDLADLDDGARSIAARDESDLSQYVWDDGHIDPSKLDVWWTSFFATGDTKYLDNLIGQVGDVEAQSGIENIMVMGAANWSLTANCRQHRTVLEYAKLVLSRQLPEFDNQKLKEIVSAVEKPEG